MDDDDTAEAALCLGPEARLRIEHRLNRLSGQVEGIRRMMRDERACEEILPQVAAIKQAVNGVAGEFLQAHIGEHVRRSVQEGDHEEAVEHIEGIVKSVLRHL